MQTSTVTHTPSGSTHLIAANKVQGSSVTNQANENLGTVRDVVLDKVDGRVRYAVLAFGGFLGMGTKLFALPWELLHYDAARESYVINIDKELLREAPGFDADNWPDMGAPEFDTGLRGYYGLGSGSRAYDSTPLV